jgi:catechol 2,3-dioxygenase
MSSTVEDRRSQPATSAIPFISAATKLGKVGLIVSNLQRSLEFYADIIGLQILARNESLAQLGVVAENRILLELEQREGVRKLTGKRLGIYHFALLLPSRADLSSFAEHLQRAGVRAGMSDHLVSEAFYLEDPDGLQIEVYADRNPKEWPWHDGELAVATQPLDLRNLLSHRHQPWAGAPLGSAIGHIHLYIGDVTRAEQLYHHGLGLNVRSRSFPGALFLAAGEYHHHVGLNTWAGNVPVASETDARLSIWELQVTSMDLIALSDRMLSSSWRLLENSTFVDPWGIALRLIAVQKP